MPRCPHQRWRSVPLEAWAVYRPQPEGLSSDQFQKITPAETLIWPSRRGQYVDRFSVASSTWAKQPLRSVACLGAVRPRGGSRWLPACVITAVVARRWLGYSCLCAVLVVSRFDDALTGYARCPAGSSSMTIAPACQFAAKCPVFSGLPALEC